MGKQMGWYLPEQLQLKITLADSDPKIWRSVEVHSGLTLHELHYVIQCVFEWDDSHLYQFFVTPDGKLTYKARREATRFHMMPPDPFFAEDEKGDRRADETNLGRVFTPQCKQIVYQYDFGDSWEHIVKLVKRTPGGDPSTPPRCLAGENAAPVDDMGGIYGFYDWIAKFEDPNDDMHEEAVAWLGKKFDPGKFDLDKANKRIAAAFKPAAKRPHQPRRKPG